MKSQKQLFVLIKGVDLLVLYLKNIQILANFQTSSYKDNYASSILFPFANRIKNGKYQFNDSNYILDCNETDKNNALHGLVYDKKFTCLHKKTAPDYASITLGYKDEGKSKGFPFKFSIELTYILQKKGISLSVTVSNEDKNSFPFTLGWHPYFSSKNSYKSALQFKSNSKYLFDSQQIISGITKLTTEMPFQLKELKLDSAYLLEANQINFFTPEYNLTLVSTSKENYLQLYTPDQPNVIAIEPMTGVSNSFNNKIGLQILQPNDAYVVKWSIMIENLINQPIINKTINTLCNS